MTCRDYVQFKDDNVKGPWAYPEYRAPKTKNMKIGREDRQNTIGCSVNYKIGGHKIDFMTEVAIKKKALPAPTAYTPQLNWKPKNNFQKASKTPKVTMTAQIMKKKKQVGPGSYNVKFESRYHGDRAKMVAPCKVPQMALFD